MVADETSLTKRLQEEGFHHTYVWQDGPNAFYSEHVHREETAHIILSGEMTLILDGEAKTLCAGERCDVPAGNWPGPYMTRLVKRTLRPPARIVLAEEFRMQLLTVTFSQLAPARLSSPV